MTTIKDGGPAFPARVSVNRDSGELQPHQFGNDDFFTIGQSLRDAFAMKAMQAAEPPVFYIGTRETKESLKTWARHCWAMADAMLKARGDQ
ncbi:hypothetical protein [Achromobacter aegrifaciens]|uniref:Uncharacterized protein n=1 Tax=Achromobacter aegrifaciens TaxID=1287736 RepID=A0AAD2IZ32_ACHAE|nr:hypothetical protein [Achromobacter aegrifaciens]CUJ01392.1 Uncharacterised protein [Achromobacter aegrifaciens]